MSNTKKFEEVGFTQGVVWACARLCDLYNQPTMALSILKEAGLKNLRQAAEYGLAILRKEDPTIPFGYDADKFLCDFCGEQFFYEEDFLAHKFNSP